MKDGLGALVKSLSEGKIGLVGVTGNPNLDLIAPIEQDALDKNNPSRKLEDYILVDKEGIQLLGKPICLKNSREVFLASPFGKFVAGDKVTAKEKFVFTGIEDYLTVPIKRLEEGGGSVQSQKAIFNYLGKNSEYGKKVYSITAIGPNESEIEACLKRTSHAVIIVQQEIEPRMNWVVPYSKDREGRTLFNNRTIIKNKSAEITISPVEYETRIAEEINKDYPTKDPSKGKKLDTILMNGVKSEADIWNALRYQSKNNDATHLVAVVTDSTIKLGKVVRDDLMHHATYIANNDELGLLVDEDTSKIDDKSYVIKLEDVLHGIRKLREIQRKGGAYQNIYVTLGNQGSISVDKAGHINWVGCYNAIWMNEPDTTGFGDTFAAGIALAESADRNVSTVNAQVFASALVSSKMINKEYAVGNPEQIEKIIEYNDIKTLYLGQFDEYNNLGNLRQKRIDRLDSIFRNSALLDKL
jgi:fructose-1-phosphate kinase PfkB-like protein